MHINPQRRFTLVFFALVFAACSDPLGESTTGQRAISQATLESLDAQLDITSGTWRSVSEDAVWARSAAPVARFRIAGGPDATGQIPVTVSNLHPEATLSLLSVDYLDDSASPGCPAVTNRLSIPCAEARAAIGDPCTTQRDCPSGLSCVAATCAPTPELDACVTPTFERDTADTTAVHFDVTNTPCVAFQYGLEPPASDLVRFGVVGPTSSLGRLEASINRLKQEDVDFVAILGENVESASTGGLDSLEDRLTRLGVSVVFVVGEDADRIESGQYALRRLGPHDHIFSMNGSRFVVFYSANRELPTNGLTRLEGLLRTVQAQQRSAGTGAIHALTHTPPIDPNGIRDLGFKNRIEGSQVMSLLNKFDVQNVFVGLVPAADHATFGTVDVWMSGSNDALLSQTNDVLVVESRKVADGDVTVRRIPL